MLPKRHLIGSPTDMYSFSSAILNRAGGKRERALRAVDKRFSTDVKAMSGLCKDLNDSMYKDELKALAQDLYLPVPQKVTKAELCKMIADYAEFVIPIPEDKYDISDITPTDINKYITTLIKTGNLAALKDLLLLNPNIIPKSSDIVIAIENNRLDILEYLKKIGLLKKISTPGRFNPPFRSGNIMPLLEFIDKNISRGFDDMHLTAAISGGPEDAIKWLMDPPRNIAPTVMSANAAAGRGMLSLLKIFELLKVLPDDIGVNSAAGTGKLNVLKWLAARNILPNHIGLANAIEEGHADVVEWIFNSVPNLEREVLQSPYYKNPIDAAAKGGHLDLVKFLYQRNPKYLPTAYGAGRAARLNRIDVVKWLADKGIFPDQEAMNYTAENGNLDIIKLLSRYPKAKLPDASGAYYALAKGEAEVVKWLANRNIHPLNI